MSLLDDLLQSGGLTQIASLAAKNPQILAAAASLLSANDRSVGGANGLGSLLGAFERNGLGDVVSSWISKGENQAIMPSQISNVLGGDILGQFSKRAGVGAGEASSVLASVLPAFVDHLTPQGKLPQPNDLEDTLGSMLSSFGEG